MLILDSIILVLFEILENIGQYSFPFVVHEYTSAHLLCSAHRGSEEGVGFP